MNTFQIFKQLLRLGDTVTGNKADKRNNRYTRGRAKGPSIICEIYSLCPRVQTDNETDYPVTKSP